MAGTGSPPKAPAPAYVLAVAGGLVVASLLGALAAGPCSSPGWVLFVSKYTVVADRHSEDNVERRWLTEAMSGAFTDLITAVGVRRRDRPGRLEFDALPVLVGLLVLAFVDVIVRYAVLRRRGV